MLGNNSFSTLRRSIFSRIAQILSNYSNSGEAEDSSSLYADPYSSQVPASAMPLYPYIGCIGMFAGNFAPAGWLLCDGSTQSIAAYDALFSVIGTRYGGDGVSNFKVPDLRGRVLVGTGQGASLTNRTLGSTGGAETTAVALTNYPSHTHSMPYSAAGTSEAPSMQVFAVDPEGSTQYASGTLAAMSSSAVSSTTGSGNVHNEMQPFLSINFCICWDGDYPASE